MNNSIQQRRKRYFALSSQIAQMDNAELASLFAGSGGTDGWGRNHTIEVGGCKVFVKRVPVTDREAENLFSTRNLYNLPTYYNYGVGSAGFGVFRELVAHIKTTNWVLDGKIPNFPLLYHYRFVPSSGERREVDRERHKGYVDYWGGNENISQYILDRASANQELVLFLEHMPHVLEPWLKDNPDKIRMALDDLRKAVAFLRKNGIIHFDAHYHNILTDGERFFLTDFGLVLDRSFALTEEESAFFDANIHYDYGEVLSCLTFLLNSRYGVLSEEDRNQLNGRYGIQEGMKYWDYIPTLVENLAEIHADGVLTLEEGYLDCMERYRETVLLMVRFYTQLVRNQRKDTLFPHTELQRLLKVARYL